MDVVSNYIGQLSASQFGNKSEGVSGNIDLNDNTFENILNNQMNKDMEQDVSNKIGELGIQSGLDIGDFDGTKPIFKTDNANNTEAVSRISESDNRQNLNFKNDDFSCSVGDIIGTVNGEMAASSNDLLEAIKNTLEKVEDLQNKSGLIVFLGKNAPEDLQNLLEDLIWDNYPNLEMQCFDGGENVFHAIIGVI